jgi:type IV secretion system protein VirD4
MAGPRIGGRRPISWRLAIVVAVVALFASNAWLKGIFGYGEIATDIPFLLFGLILFFTWRVNRNAANRQSELLGSARFGDRSDVRKLEANGDLLIGRSAKSGKLLRYDGAAHLLTMAPTRSGKGVGTIIPNLLLLDRSVICIDPKGENARVTARARATRGHLKVCHTNSGKGNRATLLGSVTSEPLPTQVLDGSDL